ncbi:antibiotic biosynthesis monooxygenase family protein [Streptomyces sp. NPDC049577]|uniref:antibiotic biosynthesis monooxygenase family protein n=1 Tax=Streptomyces sp. NPDC049577 TaxID=3155153 RepID=UPI003416705F
MAPRIFRVMLRMEIKPGQEAAFEREWHAGTDAVTGHPANLGQWLSRSADEESTYYIVSDWTDEPRFRAFEQSPEHLEHRARLHPFRSAGSFHTMHVVAHIPGKAASGH